MFSAGKAIFLEEGYFKRSQRVFMSATSIETAGCGLVPKNEPGVVALLKNIILPARRSTTVALKVNLGRTKPPMPGASDGFDRGFSNSARAETSITNRAASRELTGSNMPRLARSFFSSWVN